MFVPVHIRPFEQQTSLTLMPETNLPGLQRRCHCIHLAYAGKHFNYHYYHDFVLHECTIIPLCNTDMCDFIIARHHYMYTHVISVCLEQAARPRRQAGGASLSGHSLATVIMNRMPVSMMRRMWRHRRAHSLCSLLTTLKRMQGPHHQLHHPVSINTHRVNSSVLCMLYGVTVCKKGLPCSSIAKTPGVTRPNCLHH